MPAQNEPIDTAIRPVEARSALSESTTRTDAAARENTISVWKAESNPVCDDERRAGTTNGTSAPGGYSTLKSRYGTRPSAIHSPYFWYTGVSEITGSPWRSATTI